MGSGYSSRNALDSTYVVEQPLFSIVPSILTFDFDLIFFALMGDFWVWGQIGFDNYFGVYSYSCSTFILYVSVNSGFGFT